MSELRPAQDAAARIIARCGYDLRDQRYLVTFSAVQELEADRREAQAVALEEAASKLAGIIDRNEWDALSGSDAEFLWAVARELTHWASQKRSNVP